MAEKRDKADLMWEKGWAGQGDETKAPEHGFVRSRFKGPKNQQEATN